MCIRDSFQVVTVLTYGVATASGVVIGKTVGEGRIDDVKQYAKTLQVLYLIIGAVTSLALLGAKQFIVDLYKDVYKRQTYATAFPFVPPRRYSLMTVSPPPSSTTVWLCAKANVP